MQNNKYKRGLRAELPLLDDYYCKLTNEQLEEILKPFKVKKQQTDLENKKYGNQSISNLAT